MTPSALLEEEQERLARHAIWALKAGVEPDTEPADCGEWEPQVRLLWEAFRAGGQPQVYRECDQLLMNDTSFAAIMVEEETFGQAAARYRVMHDPQAVDLSQFGHLRADDEGNAQCVKALFENLYAYCDAYGMMRWMDTHWQVEGAEASLQRSIVYTIEKRREVALAHNWDALARFCKATAVRVRACQYMYQSLVTVPVWMFDHSPRFLNCQNGAVDLATGQLYPHDPNHYMTYCVPAEYDPKANQGEWKRFINDVVGGGPEVIEYLQRAVGYSLTGHTREECLFYVNGPTRSGKGTFSETLLKLMPSPLGVEVDFNTFTASRDHDTQNFDLAPLKPARLIFASESNKYQTLNSGKIKSLTGGDEVRCAFKHRDHFTYKPQYKMWLVSNHPVNGDVDDDALWGRVRVIEFPTSYLGKEDKNLKARLRQPGNLAGVFAWAIEGAIKWYASARGLQAPQAVVDLTRQQRQQLDYVQAWLDECCEDDPAHFSANGLVYQSYRNWCVENGINQKSQKGLAGSLKLKGYLVAQHKKIAGKTHRGVVGLRVSIP